MGRDNYNKHKLPVLYQAVIDTMMTAVVTLDHHLTVVFINPAAESLLQISSPHAVGRPLQSLILLNEHILAKLDDAITNHQSFTEREVALRLPDSITERVDFTVNIFDQEDLNSCLLIEMQPLNRLQRINQDDESVTRQETAQWLIRGLAHEVKNPLGGIRGAAQLLDQELNSDDLREYTAVIIGEADRLKTLVDRLLGPQRPPNFEPVNILKILERVVQLLSAEYPDQIHWVRDYDPSLPDLEADENLLIQAMINIVRNACQALAETPEAKISLRTRAMRQYTIGNVRHRLVLHIEIIDNGPGIPKELAERVFFPMISGRAEGTGLGLAITQNIINQHHGSIQVETRGGQTCFSIYLPFSQSHEQESAP